MCFYDGRIPQSWYVKAIVAVDSKEYILVVLLESFAAAGGPIDPSRKCSERTVIGANVACSHADIHHAANINT